MASAKTRKSPPRITKAAAIAIALENLKARWEREAVDLARLRNLHLRNNRQHAADIKLAEIGVLNRCIWDATIAQRH